MNYDKLYSWYELNKRLLPWRETSDPYRIWLSEIILQQTRVAQGMEYYFRFIEAFPTVSHLAMASEDQVLRLWQGLGYYSRARNLHKASRMIVFGQDPQNTTPNQHVVFPSTWDSIRALPGVGDYTAGAIAAFAYNLPYPALDGNVYRVLSRLFDCETPFDTTIGKKQFHQLAVSVLDRTNPRLFDSAIMELGAIHCVPQSPDCSHCPLADDCLAFRHHTVELLPVRKPRLKPVNRDMRYLFFITPDRRTLIHQRPTGDIWAHLYELIPDTLISQLPNTTVPLLPQTAHTDSLPTREGRSGSSPITFTHVLSHQRIRAEFFTIPVDVLPSIPDTIPVDISNLDDYAFSRLTLRFFETLSL